MKKSFLLLLCMFLAIVADAQVLKKVRAKTPPAKMQPRPLMVNTTPFGIAYGAVVRHHSLLPLP